VVVDAAVKQEPGRSLIGVNGEVRSKRLKKSLTGPTLLEISGYPASAKPGVRQACILSSIFRSGSSWSNSMDNVTSGESFLLGSR
jgi:hypothetical protein